MFSHLRRIGRFRYCKTNSSPNFTVHLSSVVYNNNSTVYTYTLSPWLSLQSIPFHSEIHSRFYASQIVLAFEYLHHLDIVYRFVVLAGWVGVCSVCVGVYVWSCFKFNERF